MPEKEKRIKLADIFVPTQIVVDRNEAERASNEIRKTNLSFVLNSTSRNVDDHSKFAYYFNDEISEAIFIYTLERLGILYEKRYPVVYFSMSSTDAERVQGHIWKREHDKNISLTPISGWKKGDRFVIWAKNVSGEKRIRQAIGILKIVYSAYDIHPQELADNIEASENARQ